MLQPKDRLTILIENLDRLWRGETQLSNQIV